MKMMLNSHVISQCYNSTFKTTTPNSSRQIMMYAFNTEGSERASMMNGSV